jgi:hypothetical protein
MKYINKGLTILLIRKNVRRFLSAFFLFLFAFSLAASNIIFRIDAVAADLEPGVYSVPFTAYAANQDVPFETLWPRQGLKGILPNDRILLTVKGNEQYDLRFQYYSQSMFLPENNGFIQVLDPDKIDEVKAQGVTGLYTLKAGNFDYPNTLIAKQYANIDSTGGVNQYYLNNTLGKVSFETGADGSWDKAMDNGYMTVTLQEIPDKLYVKAYCTTYIDGSYRQYLYDFCFTIDSVDAVKLPDGLTYGEGNYDLAWKWTNVISPRPILNNALDIYGPTRNDAKYVAEMNAMLEPGAAVSIGSDGKLQAVFTLANGAVNVIDRAVSRTVTYTDNNGGNDIEEIYESSFTTYESVHISTDGETGKRTFTLTYDDMAFGIFLRIGTGTANYHRAWLRLDPGENVVRELTHTDQATGITFTYRSDSVPSDTVFTVSAAEPKAGLVTLANGDRYVFHKVEFTSSGQPVTPKLPMSISVPVPDWNLDRVMIEAYNGGVRSNDIVRFLDKENREIVFSTRKEDGIHTFLESGGEIAIVEYATPVDVGAGVEDTTFAPGIYSSDVVILRAEMNTTSMSNGAFDKSYVEITNDGKAYIYFKLKSLFMTEADFGPGEEISEDYELDSVGYLSHMMYGENPIGDSLNAAGVKINAEYYSFYPESVTTDDRGNVMPLYTRIELGEVNATGTYNIGFIIPPMNYAERWARVMIKNLTPVEQGANPLPVYDKSIIRGEIGHAQNAYLTYEYIRSVWEVTSSLNEVQQAALDGYIATAQAAYADPEVDTIPEYLAARDALRAAVAALPKYELNLALAAANYAEAGYVADGWAVYAEALNAARAVAADPDATQSDIDDALAALQAAIENLQPVGTVVDKSALIAKIDAASAITKENTDFEYTDATFDALQAAITAAQAVAADADATQLAVNAQVSALQAAITALRVVTTALEDAIDEARAIVAGNYEATSYAALQAAITAADSADDEARSGPLTPERMTAQISALEAAQAALVAKTDLKYRLADGEYSLAGKTALKQFASTADSMGNGAIDHSKSYLEISDGGAQARVHLFFGPLEYSGFRGFLLNLDKIKVPIYDSPNILDGAATFADENLVPATVVSDWGDDHDQFWEASYGPYPKELWLPVELGQDTVNVHVFVPVMEKVAISGGVGNQAARLVIDWSGFDLTGQNSTATLTALEAAVAGADELTLDDYTPETAASVTASLAAAQYLITNNATLTVTNEMAAARATAIKAAIIALIAPPVEVEAELKVTPTAPDTNGKATASVDPNAINETIEAAKKDTDNNQIENAVIPEIIINAAPVGGAAVIKELAVSLPAAAVAAVKTEQAALVIDAGSAGKVTLTGAQLKNIAVAENANLTITLAANATSSLSQAQTAAIPSTAQTPVAVAIAVDETAVPGVAVSVTVPLSKTAPAAGKKFVLIKIAADGTKTTIAADFINGTVTFTATT